MDFRLIQKLGLLQNPQILRILDHDEMEIEEIGIGVDGDRNRKTALFCVTPDSDKSYAFLIVMLYSQIFQELYYQADFHYNGKLPINVNFMLDEFANVPLPDDYCSLLSTMRSRNISPLLFLSMVPFPRDSLIYLCVDCSFPPRYTRESQLPGMVSQVFSNKALIWARFWIKMVQEIFLERMVLSRLQ